MHSILTEIQNIIRDNLSEFLPQVSPDELEEKGKIYYMNGQDGTEFEWFVNGHLPPFMVFYDDKEKLGAAKAVVYSDGQLDLYLFGEHGKKVVKAKSFTLKARKRDILHLAVLLKSGADDKALWDAALDRLDTDAKPGFRAVREFSGHSRSFERVIRTKELMGQAAYVSKRIAEEGWKVGQMLRDKPYNKEDSGWQFLAGNEDPEYLDDEDHIALMPVEELVRLDPAVMKYLDSPVGTSLIRKSPDTFEEDDGGKPYMEKWK